MIVAAIAPSRADDADDLSKQLANPMASLTTLPLVFNADFGYGPVNGGTFYTLNIQPVVPFDLGNGITVLSRTILPVKFADDIFNEDVFGLSDTTQSFFFSGPPMNGLTIGVGPVFLLPTATDPRLSANSWGIGPTGVVVYSTGPWTMGVLANHLWSIGNASFGSTLSASFVQPFLSYALGGGASVSANIEASYDWLLGQWTAPLNLSYSKVFKVGEQSMSWQLGGKYFIASPAGGPEWGIRAGLTFLFPEK
jgi:hypothetical protein